MLLPDEDTRLFSKFLSPALITLSLGVEYAPSQKFTLFYSPIAVKMILVLNDSIASIVGDAEANRGIQGNPWRSPSDYDKIDLQLGGLLRVVYQNKYLSDKVSLRSELNLYANYLNESQNLDVEWRNELTYQI